MSNISAFKRSPSVGAGLTCHSTDTHTTHMHTLATRQNQFRWYFKQAVLSCCRAGCRYGDSLSVGASTKRSLIAFNSFFVRFARCTRALVCSVGVAVYPSRAGLLFGCPCRCFGASVSPDLVCLLAFQDALGVFPQSPNIVRLQLNAHHFLTYIHTVHNTPSTPSFRSDPRDLTLLYNSQSLIYGNWARLAILARIC